MLLSELPKRIVRGVISRTDDDRMDELLAQRHHRMRKAYDGRMRLDFMVRRRNALLEYLQSLDYGVTQKELVARKALTETKATAYFDLAYWVERDKVRYKLVPNPAVNGCVHRLYFAVK